MDNNQIRQLLAKYFEGNSSLSEEKILQAYFENENLVDSEFESFKRHFNLIRSGKDFPFEATMLESKILDKINSFEKGESVPVRKVNFSRLLIAASVTAFIGVSAILMIQLRHKQAVDTFSDPQLAYLEAKRTLLYVSSSMNKGMEPLTNVSKINTGAEQLKNLGKMDESLGMLHLVSFINQSSNLKK